MIIPILACILACILTLVLPLKYLTILFFASNN